MDNRTYQDMIHGIHPPRKETPVPETPELAEPRVAMLQDEPIFRHLCMKLLEEQAELGDLIEPCEENVQYYVGPFRYYALNGNAGHTLMIGDYAMVMHGEILGSMRMKRGRCAWLWCTYIEPEYRGKGLTHKFHRLGMKRLLERGFKLSMGQTMVDNELVFRSLKGTAEGKEGAGHAQKYMTTIWWPLDQPTS